MPESAADILLRSDECGVATLTLNRGEEKNALSMDLMAVLIEELKDIGRDPSVKVVVLAANGSAFCIGHDLHELKAAPSAEFCGAAFRRCAELMLTIVGCPKPVIAKVHATANAAGCQLVATCDLAIASESAKFATPGVNIGVFCSSPMVALTRAVGRKAAMEMLLTGQMIHADEAARIGLINRAVNPTQLDKVVEDLAALIASKSSHVLAMGKEAFHRQAEMTLTDAYAYVSSVMTENMRAEDAREGIDAFIAKRHPVWRDC